MDEKLNYKFGKLYFKKNKFIFHLFSFYRDTAGQERFKTITTAYYRGAMVYK